MSGALLSSAGIPDPLADDDDDVAWALQTAAVQWKRALYADAITWLRRAADSAIQAGQPDRAADLIEVAAGLTDQMLEQNAQVSPSPPPVRRGPREDPEDLLDAVEDEAVEYQEVQVVVSQPPALVGGFPNLGLTPPPRRSIPAALPPPPKFPGFTHSPAGPGAVNAPPPPPPPPVRPAPPPSMGAPPPPVRSPSFQPSRPPRATESGPPPPPRRVSKLPFEAALDRMFEQPRQAREPTGDRPSRPSSVPPAPTQSSSTPPTGQVRPSSLPPIAAVRASAPVAREPSHPASDFSEPPLKRRSNLRALIEKLQQTSEAPPGEPLPSPWAAPASPPRSAPAPALPAPAPTPAPPRAAPPSEPSPVAAAPVGAAMREPEPQPEAVRPPSSVPSSRRPPGEASRSVLGVSLATVRGLEDLPEDAQAELVKKARLEALQPEEECSFFAVALVVKGWVRIVPAISDTACAAAVAGEVVFTKGNLPQGVALGVVAGDEGAFVAIWDQAALDEATSSRPWVQEELRAVADRFQALAGAALGPLGERLDESLRSIVTERCDVRLLLPGEVAMDKGATVGGMHVVGAGRIEIVQGEGEATRVLKELAPGEFLFAPQVLVASAAPATARAGSSGALMLFASRHDTHELMAIVPPLVEILAG